MGQLDHFDRITTIFQLHSFHFNLTTIILLRNASPRELRPNGGRVTKLKWQNDKGMAYRVSYEQNSRVVVHKFSYLLLPNTNSVNVYLSQVINKIANNAMSMRDTTHFTPRNGEACMLFGCESKEPCVESDALVGYLWHVTLTSKKGPRIKMVPHSPYNTTPPRKQRLAAQILLPNNDPNITKTPVPTHACRTFHSHSRAVHEGGRYDEHDCRARISTRQSHQRIHIPPCVLHPHPKEVKTPASCLAQVTDYCGQR